jgi:hypothetical protein
LTALAGCCKDPGSAPEMIKAAELNATILDKKGAPSPIAA